MFMWRNNPVLINLSFFRDKAVLISIFLGLAFNLTLWLLIGVTARNFSEEIPLHYNIYFGVDYYGAWYQLFFLPTIGLAFLLINAVLSRFLYTKEPLLTYFLAVFGCLIQFILLIAFIAIFLANY